MESAYFLFLPMVLLINAKVPSRHLSLAFTTCLMEDWKALDPRRLGGRTSQSISEVQIKVQIKQTVGPVRENERRM